MPWRKSSLVLVCCALSMLMLQGCMQLIAPDAKLERRSSAPLAQESGLFYPLDIGNHWGYENTFTFQIVPSVGSPGDPSEFDSQLDVDVVGTEERFDRTYFVQRESDPQSGYQSDFLYRQDKTGLFNADPEPASVTASAARVSAIVERQARIAAPSAKAAYQAALTRVMTRQALMRHAALGLIEEALPGEIELLRYPLVPGKSWHVREDPLFVYTVEAQEGIALPAGKFSGWRIRIESSLFGSDDRVHVWYGRDGLLELRAHTEGEATDENGNVIGKIVSDQVQALSEISLVKKNPS